MKIYHKYLKKIFEHLTWLIISKSPSNSNVSFCLSELSATPVFLFLDKSIENYLLDVRYYITVACYLLSSFTVAVEGFLRTPLTTEARVARTFSTLTF